jgi:hypothetical protein
LLGASKSSSDARRPNFGERFLASQMPEIKKSIEAINWERFAKRLVISLPNADKPQPKRQND